MHAGSQVRTPEQRVRALPVIVGSMLMGVLMFAVVATGLRMSGGLSGVGGGGAPTAPAGGQASSRVLLLVLAVLAMSSTAGYFASAAAATSQAKRVWADRADDEGGRAALVGVLATWTIVRAALAEGFGLFGAVLILIQGSMAAWGAVGLCVLLQAALVPARARLGALEDAATGMRSMRRFGEGV